MITPAQIRAARALLDWNQSELAEKAGLSLTALNNLERGRSDPKASTLNAVQKAIEAAGVAFTNGDEPGVRIVKTKSA